MNSLSGKLLTWNYKQHLVVFALQLQVYAFESTFPRTESWAKEEVELDYDNVPH